MSLEQSVTALEQRNAELVSEVVRARDAVMGLSNMYTTITLGLAGTEDGQYFTVPGHGAYQKLYQHDGSQAPLIATYPSNSDLTDALTTLNTAMSDHVALADPHAQYAEIAGGAAANFTAMPQVGGDPIVESGSHAGGEWTRWADGTQICTHVFTGTVNGFGAGTLLDMYRSYSLNWTFPVAFIATPVMSSSVVTPLPVDGTDAFVVSNAGRVITATSASVIQMFRGTNIGNVEVCNVQATGRWK